MTNFGSSIDQDKILHENDYLTSENGYFIAYLHDDGTLRVYVGKKPELKYQIWCSGKPNPKGEYTAKFVEHDPDTLWTFGNLFIFKGREFNVHNVVWNTTVTETGASSLHFPCRKALRLLDSGELRAYFFDPEALFWRNRIVIPKIELVDLKYRPEEKVISKPILKDLDTATFTNNTSLTQTYQMDLEKNITETSGWSDSLSVGVQIGTSFKCGIPIFADGEINVQLDVNNTYEWNGSTQRSETWSYHSPVSAPPYKQVVCTLAVSEIQLTLPYTSTLKVYYDSGKTELIYSEGVYKGTNSFDSQIIITEKDLQTGVTEKTVQKIKAELKYSR